MMVKTATSRARRPRPHSRLRLIVAAALSSCLLAALIAAPASAATPQARSAASPSVSKSRAHHRPVRPRRPRNDSKARPTVVTAALRRERVDARRATRLSGDPQQSCMTGATRAGGTIWYLVKPGPAGRMLDVSATSPRHPVVISVHAIVPWAGTELTCTRATAAHTARLRHVLAPGLRYYVMIGTADGAPADRYTVTHVARPDAWTATTPIAARRQGVAAAAEPASGAVFTFGGYQTTLAPGAPAPFHGYAINRFNPTTRAWSVVAQLPVGLSYARAVRLGTKVYLPGGRSNLEHGAGCIVKTHVAFDTKTFAVTTVADQPGYYTYDYAADADPARGIYYVAGGAYDPTPCDIGATTDDTAVSNTVRAYSPSTNSWTTLPPMPTARRGAIAVVAGGWLVVAGGLDAAGHAVRTVELFNPATGIWYRGSDMPVASYGAAGGLGRDGAGRGVIVVAGGWSGTAGDVETTQVYDVNTNTWRIAAPRITARDAMASTVVGNTLWAIGGWQSQPLRAVETLNMGVL